MSELDYIDLDEEGQGEPWTTRDEGGAIVDARYFPQTKRQNCAEIARLNGGTFVGVSDYLLDKFGVTRDELNAAALDHFDYLRDLQERRDLELHLLMTFPLAEPRLALPYHPSWAVLRASPQTAHAHRARG